MNAILTRELLEVLRTRRSLALQAALAIGSAALLLIRWPTGETIDLSGERSMQVLRVFGYGLLAGVLLIVPAQPATTIVREKVQGTLALLLNTPIRPAGIYLGKLAAALGYTLALLAMTLPTASGCYLLGGTARSGGIVLLYAVLGVAALQLSTLGLLVSSRARSTDGALRATYAFVLGLTVLTLVPHGMLRGTGGIQEEAALGLRSLSPIPAVMEIVGQRDLGTGGMTSDADMVARYIAGGLLTSLLFAVATVAGLNHRMLDRSRAAGVMTQDRSGKARAARRFLFLVDPQRRSKGMSRWLNPVMSKEFITRRFGRSHWTLRLIAGSAIVSLALSCLAASGALGWGLEETGGALVLLQVSLVIFFSPSLGAGLISAERESRTWLLLRMTPLSSGTTLRGKLASVVWPLLLLLSATLPGYVVLMLIKPTLASQITQVLASLGVTTVFCILVSATVSAFFRSTATATATAYLVLVGVCLGPMLVWLGREAPFTHSTVGAALTLSPVAAALQATAMPGFTRYDLLPTNWWVIGAICAALLVILRVKVWLLFRSE